MTDALSARQTQILKCMIDEYIDTAIPVGSASLEKKYDLGVSPATIRSEMVALTKMGYLKQPHTSAGRIPTPKAMKFYVGQLMEEKQMSLADEVKAKEDVWDVRDNTDELFQEATQALAKYTKSLAVAVLDDGRVWHSGYSYIFRNPEFANVQLCANLFSLLEESQSLQDMFFQRMSLSPIDLLFGEELGWPEPSPLGVIATHFDLKGKNAALAVVGPARQSYQTVVPVLKYFGNLVQELAG